MPYHRVGTGSEAVDLYYEVKGALGVISQTQQRSRSDTSAAHG